MISGSITARKIGNVDIPELIFNNKTNHDQNIPNKYQPFVPSVLLRALCDTFKIHNS